MPAPIQTYLVLLPLLTWSAGELPPVDGPQFAAPVSQKQILISQQADGAIAERKYAAAGSKAAALRDFLPFVVIPGVQLPFQAPRYHLAPAHWAKPN